MNIYTLKMNNYSFYGIVKFLTSFVQFAQKNFVKFLTRKNAPHLPARRGLKNFSFHFREPSAL